MNIVEVLNLIPKLNKDILIAAPRIEAKESDIYTYLSDSGILVEKLAIRKAIEQQKRLIEYCAKLNIMLCNIQDREYSNRLREIPDAPAVIYYRGDISKLNQNKMIAVIGTRTPSKEGEKVSYHIGKLLSEQEYGVVNGLALGCDTYAFEGCMKAKSAYPVAVMPCGLNKMYPPQNRELSEQILEKGGCIISEYEPDFTIQKYTFVKRDRIQAGLSDGVIMIEAMKESGTMHTINYAQKYNRHIACYKRGDDIFSGNKYLLDTGTYGLENREDLLTFEEKISRESFHQSSLFD